MVFRDYINHLYCTQKKQLKTRVESGFSNRCFLDPVIFLFSEKVDIETKIILKLCNNIVKSSAEFSDLETYQGN